MADALKHFGYRVLVVDLDPSENTSKTIGAVTENEYSIVDVLNNECSTIDAIQKLPIADIIPGDEILTVELEHFSAQMGREKLLKKKLKEVDSLYDFVVIDTPPTLGLYMINAMTAADGLIIPLQAEAYSIDGLDKLFNTIQQIRDNEINEKLKVYGTLMTGLDLRNGLDRDLRNELPMVAAHFGFNNFVHYIGIDANIKKVQNIKFKDGELINRSLFENYPKTRGAKDYVNFTKELLEVIANG